MTFLAAMRPARVGAPHVFDGAIKAVSLLVEVEQILVSSPASGCIVAIDSFGNHTCNAVVAATRQAQMGIGPIEWERWA